MSLLLHSSTGETFEYDGENLYHFGIKGMKWGVRRYQNPDGSLTPEGKRRYAKYEKLRSKRNFKKDWVERKQYELNKMNKNSSHYRALSNLIKKDNAKIDKLDKKMKKLGISEDAYKKHVNSESSKKHAAVIKKYADKKGKMSANEWKGELFKFRSPAFAAAYAQSEAFLPKANYDGMSRQQRIATAKKENKIWGEKFVEEVEKILGPFPGTAKERALVVSRYAGLDDDDDVYIDESWN